MQYFHKSHINENGSVNRDIRSTTATSTKTVTSWARYPSSKLVGAVSARKRENHGRFDNYTSLLCRRPPKYLFNFMLHVQFPLSTNEGAHELMGS